MKKKDLTKARQKSINELQEKIVKLKKDYLESFVNISAGKEKNLKSAKHIKKEIAQTLTIIKEKEEK